MNNILQSSSEITRLLEGGVMPNSRIRNLLNELKKEMEVGSYRKNVKVDTLIRKLKTEGLSERENQILRLHIRPVFNKLTLAEAIVEARKFAEKVASEKVKSTAKKELRLLVRLLKAGDLTFELPKIHFKNPGKKFHSGQIIEVDEILKVIRERVYGPYRLPCLVALYTGMRRGNIIDLRRDQVDLKRREVRFVLNKSAKPMVIPISNKLAQVFAQVPWPFEDDGLLFPGICRKSLTMGVSRAFTRAGYDWFSFHKLRHTAACVLLEYGVSIATISELLGHSSIKVTMDFYAKVKPKALQEAVSKFDSIKTEGNV